MHSPFVTHSCDNSPGVHLAAWAWAMRAELGSHPINSVRKFPRVVYGWEPAGAQTCYTALSLGHSRGPSLQAFTQLPGHSQSPVPTGQLSHVLLLPLGFLRL
jgi:hypothetical protein